MIKNSIKYILQKLLGFERYLYIFSIFIIKKLKWDRNEKDFLKFLELMPDSGLLLDIGSNIGVMSYYMASQKPNAHIISFEPLAINYKNQEKIIARYELLNVQIEKYALGETEGKLEMVMPIVNNVKMHGLSHVKHDSIQSFNQGESFTVPVKTLNQNPLLNSSRAVNGIKIDVENFEYFVLKGGNKIIERDKPIIYAELWEGENRENTFNLLKNMGYAVKVIDNKKMVDYTNQKSQNFIFIPVQTGM